MYAIFERHTRATSDITHYLTHLASTLTHCLVLRGGFLMMLSTRIT